MEMDEFLEHHGVKGMKWGVRKDGVTSTHTKTSRVRRGEQAVTVKQKPGNFVRTSGGKRTVASSDAVIAAARRQVAKKSTTDALSTKSLQEAVTRMNLEIQYTKLLKQQDRRGKGKRFVQNFFGNKQNQELKIKNVGKAAQVASAIAKGAKAGGAAAAL